MVRPVSDGGGSVTSGDGGRTIVAFGVVAFVLVTASDFDTTAPLAVAFSGVILLSTVMLVGPVAFSRISDLVNGKRAGSSAP